MPLLSLATAGRAGSLLPLVVEEHHHHEGCAGDATTPSLAGTCGLCTVDLDEILTGVKKIPLISLCLALDLGKTSLGSLQFFY